MPLLWNGPYSRASGSSRSGRPTYPETKASKSNGSLEWRGVRDAKSAKEAPAQPAAVGLASQGEPPPRKSRGVVFRIALCRQRLELVDELRRGQGAVRSAARMIDPRLRPAAVRGDHPHRGTELPGKPALVFLCSRDLHSSRQRGYGRIPDAVRREAVRPQPAIRQQRRSAERRAELCVGDARWRDGRGG